MSTQEERFAQIAAAIREKDGSTSPIRALDFAARIRALQAGGQPSGGCTAVLEGWASDQVLIVGALQLADFTSLAAGGLPIEILEGYT